MAELTVTEETRILCFDYMFLNFGLIKIRKMSDTDRSEVDMSVILDSLDTFSELEIQRFIGMLVTLGISFIKIGEMEYVVTKCGGIA